MPLTPPALPAPHRRRGAVALALASALALTACTGASGGSGGEGSATAEPADVATRTPDEATTVLSSDDPLALTTAATAALFERSTAAVVADPSSPDAIAEAGAMAAEAGAPLLLAGGTATTEIDRLGAEQVVVVGPGAVSWAQGALEGSGVEVTDASAEPGADEAASMLADLDVGERRDDVVVLTTGEDDQDAAVATARAAGAQVYAAPGGDVRAVPEAIAAISGTEVGEGTGEADASPASSASGPAESSEPAEPSEPSEPAASSSTPADPAAGGDQPVVVGLGTAFGPPERLASHVATAATGVTLPGGRQVIYPGERLIALYGTPGTGALGVLGEQGLDASIARAKERAATYDDLDDVPAMPAFEIIVTVASAAPGADGDRSDEVDPETIRPWIEQARDEGVYVVLDLQPGTTDFLTQAKLYEDLLTYPNVGLALDPEWRLKPGQRHLAQIGSVGVDEVNEVVTWLADLTAEENLPQKVLLLHQFQTRMITDRERLDTSRDELAYVIHADGHGGPQLKAESYAALVANAPANIHWGWKNFYDEDTPTLSPEQTLAQDPTPEFVSYQ